MMNFHLPTWPFYKLMILGVLISHTFTVSAQTPVDSIDFKIGQMILVGIGDYAHLDNQKALLDQIAIGNVGGVIFYEKNVPKKNSKEGLTQMIQRLQKNAPLPLFVAIDEEGGRVSRLKTKYGFPPTVDAQYLGKVDHPDTTAFYAGRIASTLAELGFNVNYAPVVDLGTNPDNPVITQLKRAYSADPNKVSEYANIVVEQQNSYGVISVLKHFPGHGSSKKDTHKDMADVSDYWEFEELLPFSRLIKAGNAPAIMTAHIINDRLSGDKVPGTLSPKIIGGVLRDFLDYEGVVFSDDMQMKAISDFYGLEKSIVMAIQAGVDVLLFANNVPNTQRVSLDRIHDIVKEAVKSGELSEERIDQSYRRILNLKKQYLLSPQKD